MCQDPWFNALTPLETKDSDTCHQTVLQWLGSRICIPQYNLMLDRFGWEDWPRASVAIPEGGGKRITGLKCYQCRCSWKLFLILKFLGLSDVSKKKSKSEKVWNRLETDANVWKKLETSSKSWRRVTSRGKLENQREQLEIIKSFFSFF